MSYSNITSGFAEKVKEPCLAYFYLSNPFSKHVLTRSAYAGLLPLSSIPPALDTIAGIGFALGSMITAGKNDKLTTLAKNHLSQAGSILSEPYVNLLRLINLHVKVADMDNPRNVKVSARGEGFFTQFFQETFKNFAHANFVSSNMFRRQFVARLGYGLLGLTSVITRLFDFVIGIVAVGASVATLGKFEALNNLAYRTIRLTALISDIFQSGLFMINPASAEPKTLSSEMIDGFYEDP